MAKDVFNPDFDFGFSTVSETELKARERELENSLGHNLEVVKNVQQFADTQQSKFEMLYKMVMPLLSNLKADPDKEYILWPDRVKKIDAFIKKIDELKDMK